jgi:hypothetical protein
MFYDAIDLAGQIHNYVERRKGKSFTAKSTIVSVNAVSVIGELVRCVYQNIINGVVYFQRQSFISTFHTGLFTENKLH